jgi:hypothetical protein
MRALNAKRSRRPMLQQTARVVAVKAPTGGWNTRDALQDMPATDAIVLDNWIPDLGGMKLRSGHLPYFDDMGGPVESLFEYAPPSGLNKLFAATDNDIWDASVTGSATTADVTGLTNGRWQHVTFATPGGNFLYIVNGADAPRYYNGSTWTTPTITGATAANFINVATHMNRLWFVEKGTLTAWYLPPVSIAGAVTALPIGPLCRLGGELLAMGSWTIDGGDGMDDYAVFITTKGEVIVYQGTDPSSASTWSLVGRFRIAEPIGHRCIMRAGGDLGILTSQGLVLLSTVLSSNVSGQAQYAITDKIAPTFRDAFEASGSFFGWQVSEYPARNLIIVNVPVAERVTQHQYVANIRTGAWCRFTGMNAGAWALFNDGLFFGGNDGTVYQYTLDNFQDVGTPIQGVVQMAFQDFKTPANKRFIQARPLLQGPPGYAPQVTIKLDYDTSPVDPQSVPVSNVGPDWDLSAWDEEFWGVDAGPNLFWQDLTGIGRAGSVAFAVGSQGPMFFNQIDVVIETGGFY